MTLDPETIKGVVAAMFRPGKEKLRATLETHFAPDVHITNPLYELRSREDLYNELRGFTILWDDKVSVQEVAIRGDTALLYVVHDMSLRFLPFFRSIVAINGIVKFKDNRTIAAIHGHVSLHSGIWNLPFGLGYIWLDYLRQMSGLTLALMGSAADWGLEQVKNTFDWKDWNI